MGKSPPRGTVLVPALEKGLKAIECVHESPAPLSLTEISRLCGYSVSEMQRVVPFLAETGYFVRDDRGLYRASSKLFRLVNHHHPYANLAAIAFDAMREFAAKTGECVHLSILESGRLLIVADVPGNRQLRFSVQVGSSHEPRETVSGRVLLAFENEGESSAAGKIVKSGFEFAPSHLLKGVKDLAVPVFLPGGEVIAALATSWVDPVKGAVSREKQLLPELRQCALRIAEAIEPTRKSIP